MDLKKDDLVIFKRFSGLDTAVLEQRFNAAANGGGPDALFSLGLGLYNMAPAVGDEMERGLARQQAMEIIGDAAVKGSLQARAFVFDMAHRADKAAMDVLERMNEGERFDLRP